MENKKRLFIDKVTEDFDPSRDLTLGPWCLKEKYSIQKIYDFKIKNIYLENELTNDINSFILVEQQHKRLLKEISFFLKTLLKESKLLIFIIIC